MGKWKAALLLFVLLSGSLALGWGWQTWGNKKQPAKPVKSNYGNTGPMTMKEGVGSNWTGDIPNCMVQMVSDGQIITDPLQITTTEGEVLATMIAGSKVYYLDTSGKLQSVIRPRILKFPSGRMFAYGRDEVTEEKANELIKDPQYMETDAPGRVVLVMLSLDTKAYWENLYGPDMGKMPVTRERGELVVKYEKSRKDQLQKFIDSGDPSIGMLFPLAEPGGKIKTVILPKLKE
jgi:hypothetical protein